jgi:hypothetical protein
MNRLQPWPFTFAVTFSVFYGAWALAVARASRS